MAVSNIFTEGAKSIIGMVSKAVIEIEDDRLKDVEVTRIEDKNGISLITKTGKLKINGTEKMNEIVDVLKEINSHLISKKKRYTVRFNPSTLSLSAQGGGKVAKTNFAATSNTQQMEYTEMKPRIQLSVDLIFDDAVVSDTFMLQKLTTAKGLAVSAVDAVRRKTHTVQPQVEGFIAALHNPHTRRVSFQWGKLRYSGVLNHLNAEYTMFSISGNPVRATIRLGIICLDEELSKTNMGQWKEPYDKAFGGKSTDEEPITQNVGNLLNINL